MKKTIDFKGSRISALGKKKLMAMSVELFVLAIKPYPSMHPEMLCNAKITPYLIKNGRLLKTKDGNNLGTEFDVKLTDPFQIDRFAESIGMSLVWIDDSSMFDSWTQRDYDSVANNDILKRLCSYRTKIYSSKKAIAGMSISPDPKNHPFCGKLMVHMSMLHGMLKSKCFSESIDLNRSVVAEASKGDAKTAGRLSSEIDAAAIKSIV